MNPEEINRLNQKQFQKEEIYKYCPKCKQGYYVPTYISKCKVCRTPLEYMKQPTNQPKCPLCNSTNLKSISTINRATSVAVVGLASSKIGKQWECKNCGNKF